MNPFKKLSQQPKPLLLANVWDVPSAITAEKLGYQAIGTSSGAMATMLGYEDGEEMSFAELKYLVDRILSKVSKPLSVDIEGGYSREVNEIVKNVKALVDMGVQGINIEDSYMANGSRHLLDAEVFAETISTLSQEFRDDLFINVRTDTHLLDLPNAQHEALRRIESYQKAGADGIFIPCLVSIDEIKEICMATTLPINVMALPSLPSYESLREAGVRRISMGNFAYSKLLDDLESTMQEVKSQHSFEALFV